VLTLRVILQHTVPVLAVPRTRIVGLVLAATTLSLAVAPATAQNDGSKLLPRTRYFPSPLADPIEPRMSIGLLVTDVLLGYGGERAPFVVPDAGAESRDVQAIAYIGGTIPFFRLATWPGGGVIVAGQAGVAARFRIELPSRDDLGQDWLVGMPVEMRWTDFSARLRISHRSSHLGDEFVVATGAERVEFGGEAFDALGAWRVPGGGRLYAGGSWIFRSYTKWLPSLYYQGIGDRFVLQLGGDGAWTPFADPRVSLLAGFDWQTAERIEWKSYLSLAGGVTMRSDGRQLGFVARFFNGRSALGQFFNTPERYLSLELLAEF
jgi:hypothetical protein